MEYYIALRYLQLIIAAVKADIKSDDRNQKFLKAPGQINAWCFFPVYILLIFL